MAANPPCQFEGCENPATFTGTFFESGLSVIVCGDHFVAFAGGTLEALTGVPVLDIIATVGAEPEVEADTPTPDDEPPSSESPESSSAPTDTDEDTDDPGHSRVVDVLFVDPDVDPDAEPINAHS